MSTEQPKAECPSCNTEVAIGVVECPHCGTNIKSGETWEMKIKRSQIRGEHSEKYMRSVFVGIALAFALVILSGFFTEKGSDEYIRQHPDDFKRYVATMDSIDTLIAQGRKEEADRMGEALIKELEKREAGIQEGKSYEHNPTTQSQKLLQNLRKKVQRKLE